MHNGGMAAWSVSVTICRRASIDWFSSTLFDHDLKDGSGIWSLSLNKRIGRLAWRFFLLRGADYLEPGRRSRALGSPSIISAYILSSTFNTTRHYIYSVSGGREIYDTFLNECH